MARIVESKLFAGNGRGGGTGAAITLFVPGRGQCLVLADTADGVRRQAATMSQTLRLPAAVVRELSDVADALAALERGAKAAAARWAAAPKAAKAQPKAVAKKSKATKAATKRSKSTKAKGAAKPQWAKAAGAGKKKTGGNARPRRGQK